MSDNSLEFSDGLENSESSEREALASKIEEYIKQILTQYPPNDVRSTLSKKWIVLPFFNSDVIVIKSVHERWKAKIQVTIAHTSFQKPYNQSASLMMDEDTFEWLITNIILKQLYDKCIMFEKLPWEESQKEGKKEIWVDPETRRVVEDLLIKWKQLPDPLLDTKAPNWKTLWELLASFSKFSSDTKEKDVPDTLSIETFLPILMSWNPDIAKMLWTWAGQQVKAFLEGFSWEFSTEAYMQWIDGISKSIQEISKKMSEQKGMQQVEQVIVPWETDTKELILSPQVWEQIEMLIAILNNPEGFKNMSISVPKWYILQWSPGCGKTSVMRMIAKRVDRDKVIVFRLEPNMYRSFLLSQWEKEFSAMLDAIKAYVKTHSKHAVIFMDEFEDIARKRGNTHEVYAKELNILLRFLDGIEANTDITFIGATNVGIEELDPAIIRWWRCSTIMKLEKPWVNQIDEFIEKFMASKKELIWLQSPWMYSELKQHNLSYWDIEEILNIALRNLFMRKIRSENWDQLRLNKEDIDTAINDFMSQRSGLVDYKK